MLADLAVPAEVFRRAGYDVRICSVGPRVQSQGVVLEVSHRLASLRRADTILVPGLDALDRPIAPEILVALPRALARGVRIASVCTGAFVLAAAGLLDGRRATTHWLATDELQRRHPAIDVDPDVLFTEADGVYTSAGAAAAFDLCLHLVRCDRGAEAAATVARGCVMPLERSGGQAQFIEHEPPVDGGASLTSLLAWIEANLGRDLSLSVLARRGALSERTLSRRFREQTGTTPAKWVTRARVRRAQRLLETTDLDLERIAELAGFASATVMRACFRRVAKTSPAAHRGRFGRASTRG